MPGAGGWLLAFPAVSRWRSGWGQSLEIQCVVSVGIMHTPASFPAAQQILTAPRSVPLPQSLPAGLPAIRDGLLSRNPPGKHGNTLRNNVCSQRTARTLTAGHRNRQLHEHTCTHSLNADTAALLQHANTDHCWFRSRKAQSAK